MWIPRGQFAEGKAWVTRARDVFDQLGPIRAVALILEAAGLLEVLGGNYERALPLFERCCGIFETLPNMKDRARGMTSLAISRLVLGDPRGAGLSDQTLALYETIDDKPGKAVALLVAGASTCFQGMPQAHRDATGMRCRLFARSTTCSGPVTPSSCWPISGSRRAIRRKRLAWQ